MGLLKVGVPLPFNDSKEYLKYVREHGIDQFLNTWGRVKHITNDQLMWGDEIESGVLVLDERTRTARISIRSHELRAELADREHDLEHQTEGCMWHPEYGSWMIESTPNRPYSRFVSDLLRVERNMILRRTRLMNSLNDNEIAPTMTCFPLMGVGKFWNDYGPEPVEKDCVIESPYSKSIFVPDLVINPHPRFATLTQNIRTRRGSKVDIQMPLFRDKNTPEFNRKPGETGPAAPASGFYTTADTAHREEPDTNIHMDCMAFGMGMNCLQVTFQAGDIDESRYMYDQLAVLAPIMLALTAATPIYKGRLSDVDSRWDTISKSVDCRTKAERGEVDDVEPHRDTQLVGDGVTRMYKSRYASVSTYIYHCTTEKCQKSITKYNDIPCEVDQAAKDKLLAAGVDVALAHHIAHLFARDPLVIFESDIVQDDSESTDHFENIQSTNWQTCRWKPPPPRHSASDPHIGWRTEFRSMEVQLTDFENSAYAVFIALITRVLLAFDLKLYLPLSKVDDNMDRAHKRDAAKTEKFWFRKFVAPFDPEFVDAIGAKEEHAQHGVPAPSGCGCGDQDDDLFARQDAFEEMTLEEIFCGKEAYYPGLIPLIYAYLEYIRCAPEAFERIDEYLRYITRKVKGETITTATWIRNFVTSHPAYNHDSFIPQEVQYDLVKACDDIGSGKMVCPELLGSHVVNPICPNDAYGTMMKGKLTASERSSLLNKLVKRALVRSAAVEETIRQRSASVVSADVESQADSVREECFQRDSYHQTHVGVSGGGFARGSFPLSALPDDAEEEEADADHKFLPLRRAHSMK
jgi:glutamate--cysteine ligase catalytic subunit